MIAALFAILLGVAAPPDSTRAAPSVTTGAAASDSAAAAPADTLRFRLRRVGGFDVGPRGTAVATVPAGLALDAFDRVYVSDLSLRRLLRFDRTGRRLDESGGLGDDPGLLRRPGAVASAGALGMAVLDEENRRVLIYDLYGHFSQVGVDLDVAAAGAGRIVPTALASDRAGAMYVGDADQPRVLVFAPNGALARIVAGYAPGAGPIRGVAGLAVGRRGDVVVCERSSGRIVRIDPTGAPVASWPLPEPPQGTRLPVAIDDSLRVAVADATGGLLWLFDRGGRLLARAAIPGGPAALFFHRDGSLWVAERSPGRVARFVLDPVSRAGGP